MAFTVYDTCRERGRRLLATTDQPLTVAAIAEQLDTTPFQAARALRRLEREGAARCHSGNPNLWTTASPQGSS